MILWYLNKILFFIKKLQIYQFVRVRKIRSYAIKLSCWRREKKTTISDEKENSINSSASYFDWSDKRGRRRRRRKRLTQIDSHQIPQFFSRIDNATLDCWILAKSNSSSLLSSFWAKEEFSIMFEHQRFHFDHRVHIFKIFFVRIKYAYLSLEKRNPSSFILNMLF